MGRIMAIDFGFKRTGLAITDPLKIIANPLETVSTGGLFSTLDKYVSSGELEELVVGLPRKLDGSDTHTTAAVRDLVEKLKAKFPTIPVHLIDERFTSSLAKDTLLRGGVKKMKRRVKGNVDKISAAIILQSYLAQNS